MRQLSREVVCKLRDRYGEAGKGEKTKILNEIECLSGYHRKHLIRMLTEGHQQAEKRQRNFRTVYDEAVQEALKVAWEASDRICSKRLKALLPSLLPSMEKFGHLNLDPTIRKKLLSMSASTIDRLLGKVRDPAKKRRKKPRHKVKQVVKVRTFSDWGNPPPGYLEIDLVEHNGGAASGSFIRTLVGVDVCLGWVGFVPVLAKDAALVVEAVEALRKEFPFKILGVDSDNDSPFLSEAFVDYCKREELQFTRSRAYRKNDQAWVEQKNGAVIRRFVGYGRLEGLVALRLLSNLYRVLHLYVNFFQPSFKLRSKEGSGAKKKKLYDSPLTPCDRLLLCSHIPENVKEALRGDRESLDPILLLKRIRELQSAIARLNYPDKKDRFSEEQSIEEFVKQLGELWQEGEIRPTHTSCPPKARWWRTRKDPFERVWPEVLLWLEKDPDATARSLLRRLQEKYPGQYPDSQLRTMQRRVRAWRRLMARRLLYGEKASL